MVGKGLQDLSRCAIPPRHQAEARQRNEGVPSPIGKPGIACDDRLLLASCGDEGLRGAPQPSHQIIAGRRFARHQLAASSFGLQPWKFVVVDDPDLRQELRALSWNQPQLTDASKLVVFLGQRTTTVADVDRYLQRASDVRGTPLESMAGYRRVLVDFVENGWAAADHSAWNARQVYIALGQFMVAAAMLHSPEPARQARRAAEVLIGNVALDSAVTPTRRSRASGKARKGS